jgi:hypothetical protein
MDTNEPIVESATTRRRFLRWIGTTLAAAAGVAALPGKAGATDLQCCYDTQLCAGAGCSGSTPYPYYCDCGPFGQSYCLCRSSNTPSCITAAC